MKEQGVVTVTQRIKQIKQPKRGYIPIDSLTTIRISDNRSITNKERIQPYLVGLAVDYLTRFMRDKSEKLAIFRRAIHGSYNFCETFKNKDTQRLNRVIYNLKRYYSNIKGLDNISIICTINLVKYDLCYREVPIDFDEEEIQVDNRSISNIKSMVLRSIEFLDLISDNIESGYTFSYETEQGLSFGEIDYISANTLWDFKVSRYLPTTEQTLQLLAYYIILENTDKYRASTIKKLGIYNPRNNSAYYINTCDIKKESIEQVEKLLGITGFKEKKEENG